MNRLREVIALLAEEMPLPANNRGHQLIGNFKDYRECHLGGDWLLLCWSKEDHAVLVEVPAGYGSFHHPKAIAEFIRILKLLDAR